MSGLTCASLCSGCGGADIGLRMAGFEPVGAVEIDPEIAACYRENAGEAIWVGDVRHCDFGFLRGVDLLWASPPCPRFSVANTGRGETEEDLALARAVIRAIDAAMPRVFALENVAMYRLSTCWRAILDALYARGYWVECAIVSADDHRVPQSRERFLARAIRGSWYIPSLATMAHGGWARVIGERLRDLRGDDDIPIWQIERLRRLGLSPLTRDALLTNSANQGSPDAPIVRWGDEASWTITTNSLGRLRAWIADGEGSGRFVTLDERCLARLQSFPDSFIIPASRALAGKAIGNAVPPLLARAVGLSLRAALDERA